MIVHLSPRNLGIFAFFSKLKAPPFFRWDPNIGCSHITSRATCWKGNDWTPTEPLNLRRYDWMSIWVVLFLWGVHEKLWWFQTFFIFTPTWERLPFWLIFFQGLKPPTRNMLLKKQEPLQRRDVMQALSVDKSLWLSEIRCFFPKKKQGSLNYKAWRVRET